MVFIYDSSSGMVKIVKRGLKYHVYKLKQIIEETRASSGKKTYKFIWETKASAVHGYKPYESSDTVSPQSCVSTIKRWNPHIISKETIYSKR